MLDNNIKFIIAKSSNRNILNYTCQNNTIDSYWHMWEKKEPTELPPIEQVTFLETTMAYGIRYDETDNTLFKLAGYPTLNLKIRDNIILYNEEYVLHGIYVDMNPNSIFDSVLGIHIICDKNGVINPFYIKND